MLGSSTILHSAMTDCNVTLWCTGTVTGEQPINLCSFRNPEPPIEDTTFADIGHRVVAEHLPQKSDDSRDKAVCLCYTVISIRVLGERGLDTSTMIVPVEQDLVQQHKWFAWFTKIGLFVPRVYSDPGCYICTTICASRYFEPSRYFSRVATPQSLLSSLVIFLAVFGTPKRLVCWEILQFINLWLSRSQK